MRLHGKQLCARINPAEQATAESMLNLSTTEIMSILETMDDAYNSDGMNPEALAAALVRAELAVNNAMANFLDEDLFVGMLRMVARHLVTLPEQQSADGRIRASVSRIAKALFHLFKEEYGDDDEEEEEGEARMDDDSEEEEEEEMDDDNERKQLLNRLPDVIIPSTSDTFNTNLCNIFELVGRVHIFPSAERFRSLLDEVIDNYNYLVRLKANWTTFTGLVTRMDELWDFVTVQSSVNKDFVPIMDDVVEFGEVVLESFVIVQGEEEKEEFEKVRTKLKKDVSDMNNYNSLDDAHRNVCLALMKLQMLEEWVQANDHTEEFGEWMQARVNDEECPCIIEKMNADKFPELYRGGMKS